MRASAIRSLFWKAAVLCLVFTMFRIVAAPGFAGAAAPASGTVKLAAAQNIPQPPGLFARGVPEAEDRDGMLRAFLGIAYRTDGAIDEAGRYTLFAEQSRRFTTPGLNCSGFVLGASRFLLRKNFSLEEIKRDRLKDSGPESPHGEDWDFGWDLIMNISEGFPRSLLLPGGLSQDPARGSGFSPRGYAIQRAETWRELPARIRPGYLYLASIAVEGRRKGYGLQHYHVGLFYRGKDDKAWFYDTTGRGKWVNRRDVDSAEGRAAFMKAFADSGDKRKTLLVLEVKLP